MYVLKLVMNLASREHFLDMRIPSAWMGEIWSFRDSAVLLFIPRRRLRLANLGWRLLSWSVQVSVAGCRLESLLF